MTPLFERQVLVCCGAGGVGKTTVSTALALECARRGQRVLVLTIDPSRRLAETLGVRRNLDAPVAISAETLDSLGMSGASLDAWMLDPQRVSEITVDRLAPNRESAERLKANRMFRNVSAMIAGMQEYTAMEALHEFSTAGRYDTIVLDTPPARNALAFLDGPERLERLLDRRILALFERAEHTSGIRRAAAELIARVMTAVFGEKNWDDLQEFFELFAPILEQLRQNAGAMWERLDNPELTGFLVVASPLAESVADCEVFIQEASSRRIPLAGVVVNRVHVGHPEAVMPRELIAARPDLRVALERLEQFAEDEALIAARDAAAIHDVQARVGANAHVVALRDRGAGAAMLSVLAGVGRELGEALDRPLRRS